MRFNIFVWGENGVVVGWHSKSGYFSSKQRGTTCLLAAEDIKRLIGGGEVYETKLETLGGHNQDFEFNVKSFGDTHEFF